MSAAASDDANESVRLIRDSAAAIAPPGGDTRRIRALRFQDPGFDRGVWGTMCEMGWPGLLVAEADGGSALGMREYCALAEQLGAGLAPEPLIPASMAARLLSGADLAALLAGRHLVLPAWQERPNSLDTVGDTVIAGGKVTGRKCFVPMAAGADAFVVSGQGGLALVARGAPGLSIALEQTQDGGNFGTLSFADTPCTMLAGDMVAALEPAALATAAYLLGVMDRAFALTLDYLKTRHQFGRPIGSFQALQHRAADLKIQVALTRAGVESAAAAIDAGATGALALAAVSRAKARAADAAMLVTRQAIQLHGGIGYTDEADPGLYLRKAMVLSNLYGSAALHRARYAANAADQDD
ncbi:MAG: acyl-CoA dehydrogenase [Rhodospirillales bacterium 70-18]|nr:acyl-CoA dehydrogenase family protein [Rhodospirillales bacterium]OJY71783.1 MAG: acyl-CoA dehydrogenase [Rhodospirillales bacterium 70-18]